MKSIPTLSDKDRTRFWAKVNKDGPVVRPELGRCWEWTGAKGRTPRERAKGTPGRGRMALNGISYLSPRLSWAIHFDEDPYPFWVLHKCDNPSCVNPSHLFLGTRDDNLMDMRRKGRGVPPKIRHGEESNLAKLTEQQVKEIFRRVYAGELPRELSKEFEVSPSTVGLIAKRIIWKDVLDPYHEYIKTANGGVLILPDNQVKGAGVPTAKLTESSVLEIRRRVTSGESRNLLAKEFDISLGLVGHIVRRRIWKHI